MSSKSCNVDERARLCATLLEESFLPPSHGASRRNLVRASCHTVSASNFASRLASCKCDIVRRIYVREGQCVEIYAEQVIDWCEIRSQPKVEVEVATTKSQEDPCDAAVVGVCRPRLSRWIQ